jgi:hypothetical protein
LRKFLNLSPNLICIMSVILYYRLIAIREFIFFFFVAYLHMHQHPTPSVTTSVCFYVISLTLLHHPVATGSVNVCSLYTGMQNGHMKRVKKMLTKTALHSALKYSNCSILNL